MRSRSLAVTLASLAFIAGTAATLRAQSPSSGDGLVPGDYLRIGGGVASPVHPAGSLRDWDRGETASLYWENWQPGDNYNASNIGFGLGLEYSRLPLNESAFLGDFETINNARATSATSSGANMFTIMTSIRFRIPTPVIVPSFSLGFGFLSYQPSTISYDSPGGDGSAAQRHRNGGAISLSGGLDRQLYDRAAIFGEAVYSYAFTSLAGQGIATPGGVCTGAASGCDALKNTTMGIIRGGLRIRLGR